MRNYFSFPVLYLGW